MGFRHLHCFATLAALGLHISCVSAAPWPSLCSYFARAYEEVDVLFRACPGLTAHDLCFQNSAPEPLCPLGQENLGVRKLAIIHFRLWPQDTTVSLPDHKIGGRPDCCQGIHPGILRSNGSVVRATGGGSRRSIENVIAATVGSGVGAALVLAARTVFFYLSINDVFIAATVGGIAGAALVFAARTVFFNIKNVIIAGMVGGCVGAAPVLAARTVVFYLRRKGSNTAVEASSSGTSVTALASSSGEEASAAGEFPLNKLDRVALLIGVQEYDQKDLKLDRVHDDVHAMEAMLVKKGGFKKVIKSLNPNRQTLSKKLVELQQEIEECDASGGCVAVLYYSGHGIMDQKSKHYMLPKDCDMEGNITRALKYDCCKLEGRKGALSMLAGACAAVALFDCCRSLATPGIVRGPPGSTRVAHNWEKPVDSAGPGADNLLVAYSCGPRATARVGAKHGVFTDAILKYFCDGRTVAAAVTAIFEEVKQETGGDQKPVCSVQKLDLFARLCLAKR